MAWENSVDYSGCITAVNIYASTIDNAADWARDIDWDADVPIREATETDCGWRLIILKKTAYDEEISAFHQQPGLLAYCNDVNPRWRETYQLQKSDDILVDIDYLVDNAGNYLIDADGKFLISA